MIENLNATFEIPDALTFETGPGGFPFAKIATDRATAEICLHGGHVTAFAPAGQTPVIWMSSEAVFDPKKALRGGIPICWPWFGDHPTDSTQPAHGFARTSMWNVTGSALAGPGTVRLELTLPTENGCVLAITVGNTLSLELTSTNRSDSALDVTTALHTYFTVGDIGQVRCEGLDGVSYRDKMDGYAEKMQEGDVIIDSPTDRVYENTTGVVLIRDAALGRTIRVGKSGSQTTVVWNPWASGAAKMGDMPDDGYKTMICVEAANAGSDVISLAPGKSHTIATTIGVD